MTVFALYSVYNEAKNLPRAMDSVERVMVDRGVVHVTVDGKYPDFEGETDFSSDGTQDIAKDRGHVLPVSDYECEKRTAGLEFIDALAQDGDYVLVLDADEELTGLFAWPEVVGSFTFTRTAGVIVDYGRCRLYRWEPGLEFKGRHYDLYRANGELYASLEDAPTFDVVGSGLHHNGSHDSTRVLRKKAYYTLLRQRETHPAEVSA